MAYRSIAGTISVMMGDALKEMEAGGRQFVYRVSEDRSYDTAGNWHYLTRVDQRAVVEFINEKDYDRAQSTLLDVAGDFYQYAFGRSGKIGYEDWLNRFIDVHEPIIRAVYYMTGAGSTRESAEGLLVYWRHRDVNRDGPAACQDCGTKDEPVRPYHEDLDPYCAETVEFMNLCWDCSENHYPDYQFVRDPAQAKEDYAAEMLRVTEGRHVR